jgi:23S rRNA (cytidine1920-2'-O)/16S rRNA (cytidine1409-2'-O)-methyltransferase
VSPRRRVGIVTALVARGLAVSEGDATELVRSGAVLVRGAPVLSLSRLVAPDEPILVLSSPRFVSRGGEKLHAALARFDVRVAGELAVDVGASTGGFTDCLLDAGATRVLSVDVGHDQLHERLRADGRVVSLERTNVRDLTPRDVERTLGSLPRVVVADVSFASLAGLAAHVVTLGAPDAQIVVLVKPQFEVDHVTASKGRGVIHDSEDRRAAVLRCASALRATGAGIMGVMVSPLTGAAGNVEYLLHAARGAAGVSDDELAQRFDDEPVPPA